MQIDWALKQDAHYYHLDEHDGWGHPIYSGPQEIKVRVQAKQRLIRSSTGEEVMSDAEVWAPMEISSGPDDLIHCEGKSYRVLSVGNLVTLYGEPSHLKLFCASVQLKPIPGDDGGGDNA